MDVLVSESLSSWFSSSSTCPEVLAAIWCSLITVESLLKNHTQVTQQQLRKFFNWIVRTACSIIICMFISTSIACRVFSLWTLLTCLFARSVLRCKLRKKRQPIVCNEPRRTHSNSHLLLHLYSSNDNVAGKFLRFSFLFPVYECSHEWKQTKNVLFGLGVMWLWMLCAQRVLVLILRVQGQMCRWGRTTGVWMLSFS